MPKKSNGTLMLEMHSNIAVLMDNIQKLNKSQNYMNADIVEIKETLASGAGKIQANRVVAEENANDLKDHKNSHKWYVMVIIAIAGVVGSLSAFIGNLFK